MFIASIKGSKNYEKKGFDYSSSELPTTLVTLIKYLNQDTTENTQKLIKIIGTYIEKREDGLKYGENGSGYTLESLGLNFKNAIELKNREEKAYNAETVSGIFVKIFENIDLGTVGEDSHAGLLKLGEESISSYFDHNDRTSYSKIDLYNPESSVVYNMVRLINKNKEGLSQEYLTNIYKALRSNVRSDAFLANYNFIDFKMNPSTNEEKLLKLKGLENIYNYKASVHSNEAFTVVLRYVASSKEVLNFQNGILKVARKDKWGDETETRAKIGLDKLIDFDRYDQEAIAAMSAWDAYKASM